MNDARTLERWVIPLCGGSPAHWVLGFIDTTMKEVGIIDSAPELDSATWAMPVSSLILYKTLGMLTINVDSRLSHRFHA